MKKDELIDDLKSFFKKSAETFDIRTVFLFGSWSGGLPNIESDIDIAVVFNQNISDDKAFENITDISLILERRIGLEVNVLHIHLDFRKPMLYYNAMVLGTLIFFADFTEYVDLRNEAIYQMEDFSIFGIAWQQQSAQVNLNKVMRWR